MSWVPAADSATEDRVRRDRFNTRSSSSRLWSEILEKPELCERLERSWTVNLRALYPSVGVAELAGRFLEPWRRLVEQQLRLDQMEGALDFGPADLPGWQSLGLAIVATAQADYHPREMGLLSKELWQILLQAVKDQVPTGPPCLRLILPSPENREDAGVPECWTATGDLVGSSRAIRALRDKCARAARDRYPVLFAGETGSGKEVVARLLHQLSEPRGPFVPVNCAALPESLIECELFGHSRGAFTGATVQREGLIEAAQGGTLFLDEIAELPLPQQAKLLRVLQDGLVRPLGSTRYKQVDVRVAAATNRDLKQILAQGQLRRDLYYRLAVHEIRIPPLREHREDIPELVASLLMRWRQNNPRLVPPRFCPEAVEVLAEARWPGNVRELENVVYRLCSHHSGEAVAAADVQAVLEQSEQRTEPGSTAQLDDISLAALEQQAVEKALNLSKGNKAGAARLLGITRKALYNKIHRYRIALVKE